MPGPAGAGLRVRAPGHRTRVATHVAAVVAGVVCLLLAALGIGPAALDGVGAVVVGSSFTWILATRVGGRPAVFGLLALALGILTLVVDTAVLRSGAAVMTAAVGSVLAVMSTVPAVRFTAAVREVLIAGCVAVVGGAAAIGFEPVVSLSRFEYITLAVSFGLVFALVYRLGAGLHGLGRRGLVMVLGGGLVLGVTLAYAELLRRYGTPGLVESGVDAVHWTRDHLGAFPRPLQALLGIPALAWGCHQRARRRQGWWATAFGVAATAPVALLLVNPAYSLAQFALTELYTLLLGLLLAYVVIRLDLALIGSRGRRGRRAERAAALRPEPPRTHPLQ